MRFALQFNEIRLQTIFKRSTFEKGIFELLSGTRQAAKYCISYTYTGISTTLFSFEDVTLLFIGKKEVGSIFILSVV